MLISTINTSKTPGIILSEIRMMSATFKGVHFLVEGDDDSKFWQPRLSSDVSIVNCEGKTNLLGASALVESLGIPLVAGVYDPDFERLQGVIHHPGMLTPTDQNDLELTLVTSDALKSLLHEFGNSDRIADFERSHGVTVTQHVELMSREFGCLRYLNGALGHNVDFDRLSPYRFVSIDTWLLDRVALIQEYAALSGLTRNEVEALISSHCPQAPRWYLSQGHDSVRILAHGLRRRIGKKQMSEQDVTKVLRIAFSPELLHQSDMYRSLCQIQQDLSVPIFN